MIKTKEDALEFLGDRRKAYQLTFSHTSVPAQEVMKDLTQFCHWGATPFNDESERATCVMIGRQQVLLRIKQHLGLTDEQLFAIASGQPYTLEGLEDNG